MEIIYSCQAPEAQRFQQPAAYSVLSEAPVPFDDNAELYWHIHNFGRDMEPFHQVGIFDKAFGDWERNMFPCRFISTADPKKAKWHIYHANDNIIDLPNGDTMDSPYDFNKAPGVLAVQYTFGNHKYSGWMVVNDDHQYGLTHSGHAFDVYMVIRHEIGHGLHIGHGKIPEGIMFGTYNPNADFIEDTLKAIDHTVGPTIRKFVKTVPQAKRFIKHYVQTVGEPERPKGCKLLKAVKGLLRP